MRGVAGVLFVVVPRPLHEQRLEFRVPRGTGVIDHLRERPRGVRMDAAAYRVGETRQITLRERDDALLERPQVSGPGAGIGILETAQLLRETQ